MPATSGRLTRPFVSFSVRGEGPLSALFDDAAHRWRPSLPKFLKWQTGLPSVVLRFGITPRLRDVQGQGFFRGSAKMTLNGNLCRPLEAVGLVFGNPDGDPDQLHILLPPIRRFDVLRMPLPRGFCLCV